MLGGVLSTFHGPHYTDDIQQSTLLSDKRTPEEQILSGLFSVPSH